MKCARHHHLYKEDVQRMSILTVLLKKCVGALAIQRTVNSLYMSGVLESYRGESARRCPQRLSCSRGMSIVRIQGSRMASPPEDFEDFPGSNTSWPSPALSDIAVNNSTWLGTDITLTAAQKDMTGSLVSLGCLLGAWCVGAVGTRLGRRLCLQFTAIPLLVGSIALSLSTNVYVMLGARLLQGFGSGSSSAAGTLYVVEVADTSVRGAMTTVCTLAIVLGGLFVVGVGCVLHWYHLALVCAIPPIILLIGTFFLPKSPAILLVRGKRLEAVRTLRRLRGPYANLQSEIQMLEMKNSSQTTDWKKILNRRTAKRLAVVVMLFAFQHFCGNYVFIVHTARILEKVGAPWDPDMGTVLVTAVRLAGTMVSIFLVDRMGRRSCLVASHAIASASLVMLGTYVYLAEGAPDENTSFSSLGWVPLLCVVTAVFGIFLGAHPVPYCLAAEYFPTSIRSQTFSICYSAAMLFSFLVLQVYSPMQDALTHPGLYWFYSASSCLAVAFTLIFVEETKGKNIG
ncbi:facilitated trehalose transporter Tret1-2 homolog [Eriocheir sinensis]|uniref:facilitated trehalose transporter Tret1-2 homolog n=1 Tax=Eriocheir sinensis TaxID=95602 RepID=UPI0021CAD25A|nr:facilitated trehalose transporter Tret1-2 homolog [Eriocheir sinensis]